MERGAAGDERAKDSPRDQQRAGRGVFGAALVRKSVHVHRSRNGGELDCTPVENGLGTWRRLVQSFDPASALVRLNLMSTVLTPEGYDRDHPVPHRQMGRYGSEAGRTNRPTRAGRRYEEGYHDGHLLNPDRPTGTTCMRRSDRRFGTMWSNCVISPTQWRLARWRMRPAKSTMDNGKRSTPSDRPKARGRQSNRKRQRSREE